MINIQWKKHMEVKQNTPSFKKGFDSYIFLLTYKLVSKLLVNKGKLVDKQLEEKGTNVLFCGIIEWQQIGKLKGGQRYPVGKGVMLMLTVFQTLMLMIAFASLVLSIISFRDKK